MSVLETVLDEKSGILYTATVFVWPVPTFTNEKQYFCGNIFLDSEKAASSVQYKLRVETKVKHKGKVRCSNGHGLLEVNSYHQIRIKIMEEAIQETELQLILNGKRLRIAIQKSKEGERVYGNKHQNIIKCQMLDTDLLKKLPVGVAECIKDGQQHNARKHIFEVVYPLVLQMLKELGQRTPQLGSISYFDIWEETNDPIHSIMDYVLLLLQNRATEVEKA